MVSYMLVNDLINSLEDVGYLIGNIRDSDLYKTIKNNEVKVAGYARLSDENSSETSIPRQNQAIYNFSSVLGIIDDNINFYEDEVSGTNLERFGYRSMLNDCYKGKANIVMVASLNRLGRDAKELIRVAYDEFYKNSIILICLQELMINAPDLEIEFQTQALEAERNCQKTSRAVRAALAVKMKGGSYIGSSAPYGYEIMDIIDSSKKFPMEKRILVKANDGTAEIVLKIFNMYKLGNGYFKIANDLGHIGIMSPEGKQWSTNAVKRILENPLYAGIMAQGRYQKQGYKNNGFDKKIKKKAENEWVFGGEFEGIISKELFYEIQKEMSNRGTYRKKDEPRMFGGILKCGDCGKALVYRNKGEGYKCSKSQKGGGCTTHFVKENEISELIKDEMKKYLDPVQSLIKNVVIEKKDNIFIRSSATESVRALTTQINGLESKIATAYERFDAGILKEHDYKLIAERYQKQKEKLMVQKEYIDRKGKNQYRLNGYVENYVDKFLKLDNISNAILRALIEKISIYQDGRIEIYWKAKGNNARNSIV
jgi:site-specific DNA recombinase